MNNKGIRNIIFDLGGVIIDIDPARTFRRFEQLTDQKISSSNQALDSYPFFSQFERGIISSDDFLDQLKAECKQGTSELDVLNAWNAILLDIEEEKRDLLLELKEQYRIFLLSNTNEIHRLWIDDYIQAHFGDNGLSSWFEKVYTSYELNLQKPEKEIFEIILKENDLKPEETLFLDDTEKHLEGAKVVGINTALVSEERTILDIFEDLEKSSC